MGIGVDRYPQTELFSTFLTAASCSYSFSLSSVSVRPMERLVHHKKENSNNTNNSSNSNNDSACNRKKLELTNNHRFTRMTDAFSVPTEDVDDTEIGGTVSTRGAVNLICPLLCFDCFHLFYLIFLVNTVRSITNSRNSKQLLCFDPCPY